MQNQLWPPNYTLRHSTRARHLNLRVCPRRGLLVVIPKRFNLKEIPSVLEKHRTWIERTLQRVHVRVSSSSETPTQVFFQALDETWEIVHEKNDALNLHLKILDNKRLLLSGNTENPKLVRKALGSFTQHHAERTLIPWLSEFSKKSALPYQQAKIRDANTLWGSCSHKRNISLNQRLLFLPKALVEYVMLHELCHTVHMNHSKKFWELLQEFSPNCFELRQLLRQADQYLPAWL